MAPCTSYFPNAIDLPSASDSSSSSLPSSSSLGAQRGSSGEPSSSFIFTASSEGWTNATFASWLCGNLSSLERELEASPRPLTSLVIQVTFDGSGSSENFLGRARFLLPECFYGLTSLTTQKITSHSRFWSQLKSLSLSNVLIAGNQHHPNPITRLAKPALNLETLSLTAVALVDASGTAACIDLDTSLSELSTITELVIKDSRLGSGTTLPTLMRSRLVRFDVSGSLPIEVVEQAADMTDPKVDVTAGQSWSARETQKAFDERDASATLADDVTTVDITLTSANSSSDIANAICNADVRTVWIQVQSGSFGFPPCTANTSITSIRTSLMDFPDFTLFPTTLTSLTLEVCKGYATNSNYVDLEAALARFPDLGSFTASRCGISGTLPSKTQTTLFSVVNNNISGTVNPYFFVNSPKLTTLTLEGNQLTGTFPWYGLKAVRNLLLSRNNFTRWPPFDFNSYTQPPSDLTIVSLSNNPYLSEIPNPASFAAVNNMQLLLLNGLPLLAGQKIPISSAAQMGSMIQYDITGCGLIGSLPELPAKLATTASSARKFLFGNNRLSGSFPASWSNYTFSDLVLSNNIGLTGTLPRKLFGPARLEYLADARYTGTALTSFLIEGTSLTGPMTISTPDYDPNLFANAPIFSAQNAVSMDFCASSFPTLWNTTTSSCNLRNTSAYYCQERYNASDCLFSLPTPPPCDYTKRPSAAFVCNGTSWTLYGSYNETTLTIPSSGSEVIVVGDVTSSSVVITGLGSKLVLQDGCATNLTSVTIELTPDEIKRLGSISTQLLVSTNSSSNCSDLSNVNIYASVRGDSCKKASAKSVARGGQLSALFTIDSSRCRTWWIILVAVLASVVVILVVVFVLLVIFVRPVREMVRPYSKRNKAQGEAQLG